MRSFKFGVAVSAVVASVAMTSYAQQVPAVGPELELAAPSLLPSGAWRYWVASSGSTAMTLFQVLEHRQPAGYYGSILLPDGSRIGSGGFPVLSYDQGDCHFLVHVGAKFVAGCRYGGDWFAIAIDPATGAVDPAHKSLFSSSEFPTTILAAGNEGGFLFLASEEPYSQHGIWARAFSQDFQPLGGDLWIEPKTSLVWDVRVGSDGSGWLVSYHHGDSNELRGRHISATGEMGAAPIVFATNPLETSLAALNGKCLQFYTTSTKPELQVATVEADGTLNATLQTLPIQPGELDTQGDGTHVGIAWTGACGSDPNAMLSCASLLGSDGQSLATTTFQIVDYGRTVTTAGGNLLTVGSLAGLEVESAEGPDLTKHSTPAPVALIESSGGYPSVAYDGKAFLVVWSETAADGTTDLVGARVAPDGTVLDAPPVPLVARPGSQSSPKLVFDGSRYRLIWIDTDGVRASLLTPALQMLSPEGKTILADYDSYSAFDDGQRAPALATDGTRALVAFNVSENSNPKLQPSIGARLFDADWQPLSDDIITLATETEQDFEIGHVAASYGGHFLVSWIRQDFWKHEIHASRITAAGKVLDSSIIGPEDDLSTDRVNTFSAFGSGRFLVGWETNGIGEIPSAARIGLDGTPYDGKGFTLIPGNNSIDMHAAAVAFDGSEFVVAMEHDEGHREGLRLVSIGLSGPGTAPTDVPDEPSHIIYERGSIAMASDCAGHTLLAYDSPLRKGDHPFVTRVRARMLTRDSAAPAGAGCALPPPIDDGSTPGAGGASGTGGAGGSNNGVDAGQGGSRAGSPGDAGPNSAEVGDSTDSGCGCSVPGKASRDQVQWMALALGLAAIANRKRRRHHG